MIGQQLLYFKFLGSDLKTVSMVSVQNGNVDQISKPIPITNMFHINTATSNSPTNGEILEEIISGKSSVQMENDKLTFAKFLTLSESTSAWTFKSKQEFVVFDTSSQFTEIRLKEMNTFPRGAETKVEAQSSIESSISNREIFLTSSSSVVEKTIGKFEKSDHVTQASAVRKGITTAAITDLKYNDNMRSTDVSYGQDATIATTVSYGPGVISALSGMTEARNRAASASTKPYDDLSTDISATFDNTEFILTAAETEEKSCVTTETNTHVHILTEYQLPVPNTCSSISKSQEIKENASPFMPETDQIMMSFAETSTIFSLPKTTRTSWGSTINEFKDAKGLFSSFSQIYETESNSPQSPSSLFTSHQTATLPYTTPPLQSDQSPNHIETEVAITDTATTSTKFKVVLGHEIDKTVTLVSKLPESMPTTSSSVLDVGDLSSTMIYHESVSSQRSTRNLGKGKSSATNEINKTGETQSINKFDLSTVDSYVADAIGASSVNLHSIKNINNDIANIENNKNSVNHINDTTSPLDEDLMRVDTKNRTGQNTTLLTNNIELHHNIRSFIGVQTVSSEYYLIGNKTDKLHVLDCARFCQRQKECIIFTFEGHVCAIYGLTNSVKASINCSAAVPCYVKSK